MLTNGARGDVDAGGTTREVCVHLLSFDSTKGSEAGVIDYAGRIAGNKILVDELPACVYAP